MCHLLSPGLALGGWALLSPRFPPLAPPPSVWIPSWFLGSFDLSGEVEGGPSGIQARKKGDRPGTGVR